MQLYNLQRNTENAIGGVLETKDDMHFIQSWCEGKGYACHVNIDAAGMWTMSVISPDGHAQPGFIGYWAVVIQGTEELLVTTAERGAEKFTVLGPIPA